MVCQPSFFAIYWHFICSSAYDFSGLRAVSVQINICLDLYHETWSKFGMFLCSCFLTFYDSPEMYLDEASTWTQVDSVKREIYVAFNANHLPVMITLPERPGFRWEALVDTSKPAPYDFLSRDLPGREIVVKQYAHFLDANIYPMLSYSSIILLLRPEQNA